MILSSVPIPKEILASCGAVVWSKMVNKKVLAILGATALAVGSANAQVNNPVKIRDGNYRTPDGKKECSVYTATTTQPYDLRDFDRRTYGKNPVREQSLTCDDNSTEPALHVFVLNGGIYSFHYKGSPVVHVAEPERYEALVKSWGEQHASEVYAVEGSPRLVEVKKRFDATIEAASKHPVRVNTRK